MTTAAEKIADQIIAMQKDYSDEEVVWFLEGRANVGDLDEIRDLLGPFTSSNETNAADVARDWITDQIG